MQNEGAATAAKTTEKITVQPEALTKAPKEAMDTNSDDFGPVFVEAGEMFEKLAEFTKETTQKAYEFFERRGGEFGKEVEDWFRAELEVLMPVTAEITETDDKINVRAAVPGFKPDEIRVSVKDNVLILSGETESRRKQEDENTIFSEWRSNRFCRQLPLSSQIDTRRVKAKLKDGVLQLTLPKSTAQETKEIPVSAG